MPTTSHFNRYPPFPDNVAVADLPRLSLSKLLKNDVFESEQLYRSCREIGFFLLDLKGSNAGETLLGDAENVFRLAEEIFGLEQDELAKFLFNPSESLFGYKPVGKMKLEDGSPDGFDFYGLGQDDMLGNTAPRSNPKTILDNRKTFQDMFHHGYAIACHLLSHLEQHLSLTPGTLASLCPQDKPSSSMLRMLRSLPQKSHRTNVIGHTDLGCITILFNVIGGLQILPIGSENVEKNWVYVRPEPDCAIINLGDAMVQWSGGILRSNIHRVTTPPGRQADSPRYSMAYFLRPAAKASMQRLYGGGVIPPYADGEGNESLCAQDWEKMRTAQIVAGNSLPRSIGGGKL